MCGYVTRAELELGIRLYSCHNFKLYFIYLFIFDNFVVYFTTPSVLQEGGNRLSPPELPLGPVCVN